MLFYDTGCLFYYCVILKPAQHLQWIDSAEAHRRTLICALGTCPLNAEPENPSCVITMSDDGLKQVKTFSSSLTRYHTIQLNMLDTKIIKTKIENTRAAGYETADGESALVVVWAVRSGVIFVVV